MWPQLQISEKTQFTFSLVNSCPLECNVEASWNWNWCRIFKIFLFAVIIVEINYSAVESMWHGFKILVTCVTVKCLYSLLCKLLLEILGVTKPVQFKETDREWKYCPKSSSEKIQSQRKMNSSKCFYLFNCDNTYDLDFVEKLLDVIKTKTTGIDIQSKKEYFRLHHMPELTKTIDDRTSDGKMMDYAIFAVNAHESRLSINEDNAGISYANIYRALLRAMGEYLNFVRPWLG